MFMNANRQRYSYTPPPPPKKSKKETKIGLIVLGVIVLLVILLVVFATVSQNTGTNNSPTQLVNMPAVQTMLVSETGTTHMFGARVVLEIDNSAGDVDHVHLHRAATAAIAALSYDDIISFQGPDIIRNAVRDRVASYLGEGELIAVFLTEVMSDIPMLNRDVDRDPGRNTMFDAIFGSGN